MTSAMVVEKMMSVVRKYLTILDKAKSVSESEYIKDIMKKGGLEHYLYLAAQSTIDLADVIVAYKSLRRPSTLSEAFVILNESEIIDQNLTQKLVKMTSFRNLLAHDYEKVDFHKTYSFLQNDLADIEEFLSEVKTKLKL